METVKSTIAKNIASLRTAAHMTQADLAEKLHYSDKAVSKWERSESVPEIGTLIAISDLFGVSLDHLVRGENIPTPPATEETAVSDGRKVKNRALISGMSVLLVWFVAVFAYALIDICTDLTGHWLTFIYAVPVSMLVWLIFNSIWFDVRRNFLIISLLGWTALAAFHITFLTLGVNVWPFYLLGIPGQIIVILWSKLRKRNK